MTVSELMKELEALAEKEGKPLDWLAGPIEEALEKAYEQGKDDGWTYDSR